MKSDRPIAIATALAALASMLPFLWGAPKSTPAVAAAEFADATISSAPAITPAPFVDTPSATPTASTAPTSRSRDEALRKAATDASVVALGKENYASFCQACHGEEGNKADSPSNLFDTKWYHGGTPAEIEHTILTGVLEKGMPGWGEILAPEDTTALTAYLLGFPK